VKATTEQLVSALRVLSVEMHSEDGVANAVVAEAADRLTLMANLVARHVQETKDDVEQMAVASETMVEATAKIQRLRARIQRLEEAGDAMHRYITVNRGLLPECTNDWRKAKEDKL
jgi:chemotaxis regulatin CheY-phosphate phosphatase CheZ